MKKKVIKLNEAQIKKIVAESVRRVLKEAEVVRGTDTYTDISRWADEWDEYSSKEQNRGENTMAPDFIQTWATRLENRLNNVFYQKYPEMVEHDGGIKQFAVTAHLDNDSESSTSLFSGYDRIERRIVLEVGCNNTREFARMYQIRNERACNICVQMITKCAMMMFGSVEGATVSLNGNRSTKYDGSMDVIVTIDEAESFERGRYDDLETTGKPRNGRLFRNNPSRQIPKDGSTYHSEEEDY